MKYKIEKADWEKLPSELQEEYREDGETYVLKVEDAEGKDMGNLVSARDHEKEARKAAEAQLKTLEKEKGDLEKAKMKAEKDAQVASAKTDEEVKAIEASYKTKLAEKEQALKDQQAAYEKSRSEAAVNSAAMEIANKISTVPKLLAPEIAKRLRGELPEGADDYQVRVLDSEGKPSANNLDDLAKEFVDNTEFKGIIRASNASGGGADPKTGRGGAAVPDIKQLDIANGDPKQVAAAMKARRQESNAS